MEIEVVEMSTLLRKKPDPNGGFKWMVDWENVLDTPEDKEAYGLYQKRDKKYCDFRYVCDKQSTTLLLAFLRYDYKKALLRTRYLYIDRLRCNDYQIRGGDLDMAYFESLLLCFPTLEFLGRLLFSGVINWLPEDPKTKIILLKVLTQMGNGYKEHAERLVLLHRHALAHELRPDGNWIYDLNTEDKYGSPRKSQPGDELHLNIPHFIDSSLLEIEKLCDQLTGPQAQNMMASFSQYISKRFPS